MTHTTIATDRVLAAVRRGRISMRQIRSRTALTQPTVTKPAERAAQARARRVA
jgi:hypothetical protein